MTDKPNYIDPLTTAQKMGFAVEQLEENMAAVKKMLEIDSVIKKAKFDSLIKAGFTETQALALCRDAGPLNDRKQRPQ